VKTRLLCCLAAALASAGPLAAADDPKDQAAIQKNAEGFVEAFHKGDAKALAAFWATDGDYTDQTGRHLHGRDAIEKAFAKLFADNKGLKVGIDSHALRFLTPDVAIEDGVSSVFAPDGGPPSRARYTIVHVKKDGQWYLGSVRDAAFAPPSNRDHLSALGPLLGNWTGDGENGTTERLSFGWAENQSFVVAAFATLVKDVTVAGSNSWIGWDPLAKTVRSWMFDATGSYGDGTWAKDGNKWVIKTATVHPDGTKSAATFVLTVGDGDSLTLQMKDRSTDGKPVPDGKEIKLKRVK
jgi:uncharacterized protein (TIGR02246 family)